MAPVGVYKNRCVRRPMSTNALGRFGSSLNQLKRLMSLMLAGNAGSLKKGGVRLREEMRWRGAIEVHNYEHLDLEYPSYAIVA